MEFKGANFQNSDCFDAPTAKFEFKPPGPMPEAKADPLATTSKAEAIMKAEGSC